MVLRRKSQKSQELLFAMALSSGLCFYGNSTHGQGLNCIIIPEVNVEAEKSWNIVYNQLEKTQNAFRPVEAAVHAARAEGDLSRKRALTENIRARAAEYLSELSSLSSLNLEAQGKFRELGDLLRLALNDPTPGPVESTCALLGNWPRLLTNTQERLSVLIRHEQNIHDLAQQTREIDQLAREALGIADRALTPARECHYDCHKRCGVKIGPIRKFVEPTCHLKCEGEKKICYATGIRVPDIPITPREIAERAGTQTCMALFQAFTKGVIAHCANWEGRTRDGDILQRARELVISAGVMGAGEFEGVNARWCPLSSGTDGMAPDRGVVYLNHSLKTQPLPHIATKLAHEMIHIRQYGSMGTDNFKCTYSRKLAECGFCQDQRHPLEREAYDFEARVAPILASHFERSRTDGAGPTPPATEGARLPPACLAEVRRNCEGRAADSCVIVHLLQERGTCVGDCFARIEQSLKRLGITVYRGHAATDYPGHPPTPGACVGPRIDIAGSVQGAQCLAQIMTDITGKRYSVIDHHTCARSGWPYNIHLH